MKSQERQIDEAREDAITEINQAKVKMKAEIGMLCLTRPMRYSFEDSV